MKFMNMNISGFRLAKFGSTAWDVHQNQNLGCKLNGWRWVSVL